MWRQVHFRSQWADTENNDDLATFFLQPKWHSKAIRSKTEKVRIIHHRWVTLYPNTLNSKLIFFPEVVWKPDFSVNCYSACWIQKLVKSKKDNSVLFPRIKRDPPCIPASPALGIQSGKLPRDSQLKCQTQTDKHPVKRAFPQNDNENGDIPFIPCCTYTAGNCIHRLQIQLDQLGSDSMLEYHSLGNCSLGQHDQWTPLEVACF